MKACQEETDIMTTDIQISLESSGIMYSMKNLRNGLILS